MISCLHSLRRGIFFTLQLAARHHCDPLYLGDRSTTKDLRAMLLLTAVRQVSASNILHFANIAHLNVQQDMMIHTFMLYFVRNAFHCLSQSWPAGQSILCLPN